MRPSLARAAFEVLESRRLLANITGSVYQDNNGDGILNGNDTDLGGRVVWADLNQDGVLDAGEPQATTQIVPAGPGTYTLVLPDTPGQYLIRQQLPPDWIQTGRVQVGGAGNFGSTGIVVLPGDLQSGAGAPPARFSFLTTRIPQITGYIYVDHDGDGFRDVGENMFATGGIVYLDANNDGIRQQGEAIARGLSNSGYSFTGLQPGTYIVRYDEGSGPALGGKSTPWYEVTVNPQQTAMNINFGVVGTNTIPFTVFHDANGSGSRDTGEFGLAHRTIWIDRNNNNTFEIDIDDWQMTDDGGVGSFARLPGGTYTLRQILSPGYRQTAPVDNLNVTITVPSAGPTPTATFGASNTGQINLLVFNDVNANGTRDVSGQTIEPGIAGRTVYLDLNNNSARDTSEPSLVTDEFGNAFFKAAPQGSYYVRQILPQDWIQTTPANNLGLPVTVTASYVYAGNFGTVQQVLLSTISGVAWEDFDGDTIRDNNEPSSNARTVYLDANNNGVLDTGERSFVTSTNGAYSFDKLPANTTQVVRVVAPAGMRQSFPDSNAAQSVFVSGGQTYTGRNFGLTSSNITGGVIRGTIFYDFNDNGVRDGNESGLSNGQAFIDTNGNGILDTGERSTGTSASGEFGFAQLAPGTYLVRAVIPSIMRITQPIANPVYSVTLTTNQVASRDFGMTDRAAVSGYLFNDRNGNGLDDSGEEELNGWQVYLDLNGNSQLDSGEPSQLTAVTGGYTFRNLAPASYVVRLVPQSGWRSTNGDNRPVTMALGQWPVVRQFGVQQDSFNASISGTVFNDADNNGVLGISESGVSGATVFIDADNDTNLDPGEVSVVTGSTGNFAFSNLSAGTHVVRAEVPDGFWRYTVPVIGERSVTLTPGQASTGTLFGMIKPAPATPYSGTPITVSNSTVTIEAELFDKGGELAAYHDNDASNGGAPFRTTEGVDLKLISGSNYRVNNTFADEWLKYSINVPADATYDVTFRVSSKGSNGQFHLDIPDAGTLGPVHLGSFTIPNTGSNDTWTTVTKRVFLSTGQYSLRLYMDANSTYGSVGNFDWIRLTPVSVTPPPPTGDTTTLTNSIAAYVRDGASATTNFGNDAQLIVKLSNTTGNKREGYLKFDVSSLPSDPSAITNVKLRLNGKLSASGASPIVGVFGAANTSWAETSINWNTKPATSGSALATKTISGTTAAWYEWDITSYVKTARQNGQQFVTLVLRATNATDPQAVFNSDDAASNGPQLVATTTGGTSTPTQALVVTPDGLSVPEAGQASFGVKLAAAPASNVTVMISKQAGSDADVNATTTTLTFTPANWNVSQAVTLAAAADGDSVNGQAFFSVASSGLTTVNVIAIEADDDGPVSEPTIYLGDGAYVRGGTSAGLNFGTASDLVVKKASADSTRETYIKFDLSDVTAVTSAKLRLNARLSDTSIASLQTQIFSTTNTSWTESGLTWNNKPASGTTVHGSVTVTGTAATWYEVDLTSFIQAEIAAGRTFVTLVLKNPVASAAQTVIASDETVNGPQLVVG